MTTSHSLVSVFCRAIPLCCVFGAGDGFAAAGVCQATRTLPECYRANTAFNVSIDAQPGTGTGVYAVVDTPPTGWSVSSISHGGNFDAIRNKVKWGIFFDNSARILTYTVTAPTGQSGIRCFTTGLVSCDGVSFALTGDNCFSEFCELRLNWYTIDGGGGAATAGSAAVATGGGLELSFTLGQPEAVEASGDGLVFVGGFWGGSATTASPQIPAVSSVGLLVIAAGIVVAGLVILRKNGRSELLK